MSVQLKHSKSRYFPNSPDWSYVLNPLQSLGKLFLFCFILYKRCWGLFEEDLVTSPDNLSSVPPSHLTTKLRRKVILWVFAKIFPIFIIKTLIKKISLSLVSLRRDSLKKNSLDFMNKSIKLIPWHGLLENVK